MSRIAKIPLCAVSMVLAAGCAGTAASTTDVQPPAPVVVAPVPPPAPDELVPPPAPALRLGNAVLPLEVRVELTIEPAKDHFTGAVEIELSLLERTDHIWLHATELELHSASLNTRGQRLPLTRLATSNEDFLGLGLGLTLPPGKATLRIEYTGALSSKDYTGIFKQREGEHEYVFTQLEAVYARRLVPCFDEPRFKVPWQLTLHVPADHIAAANAPVEATIPGPRGLTTYRFARTRPLPSYLVALAVGPFDIVDMGQIGRARTPTRILVPRGRAAETRSVVEVMPQLLDQLETYFDTAYPYEKLDSVALPHFFGAMENPGLITYNAALLLAPPGKETLWFRRSSAVVMAHELAHQWFGNLVTLDWWDDIWLNESFATWMARKVVAAWQPSWDLPALAVNDMDRAMAADSLVSARSIRQPITTSDDIASIFNPISYSKGSVVLSMFERWVGEDRFRDGVRRYLRDFSWGTATAEDFLAALAEVSDARMGQAFQTFLGQPGVPLLHAELSCAPGQAPSVALAQERLVPIGSRGSSEARWSLPVCVKHGKGAAVAEQCTLLTERAATLPLDGARACPDWIMANAGARGYYRVVYSGAMLGKLLAAARHLDVAERMAVIGDLRALVATGKMPLGEALGLVPALLKDASPLVARRVVDMVAGMDRNLVPDRLRPHLQRFVRKHFGPPARKLGWAPAPGESDETRMLRGALLELMLRDGEDPALLRQAAQKATAWLATRQGIDVDLLGLVLGAAVRSGPADLYDRVWAQLETSADPVERRALLQAMASTADATRLARNLELFASGAIGLRDASVLLQTPLASPATQRVVYDYIKSHYDQLVARLPRHGGSFLISSAASFCDAAQQEDARAFFEPRVASDPGGPAALAKALEQIELCAAYRAAQQPSVELFLQRQ